MSVNLANAIHKKKSICIFAQWADLYYAVCRIISYNVLEFSIFGKLLHQSHQLPKVAYHAILHIRGVEPLKEPVGALSLGLFDLVEHHG